METLKKSLEKGDIMTMTHGLAAWRDEMIDEAKREATREATRKEDIKIARYFKDKGIPVENIAEATGLTVDEILQL
jgi:predicted transposase/invertase (TIGR01784 family)